MYTRYHSIRVVMFLMLLCCLRINALGVSDTLSMVHTTWDELRAAPNNHKIDMVCIAPDNCPEYLRVKAQVLANRYVIHFYDSAFNNYLVDQYSKNWQDGAKQMGVTSYPTFLFLNARGEVIHKLVGYFSATEFIAEGRKVISGSGTLAALRARYQKGERTKSLLLAYCYAMDNAHEMDSSVVHKYVDMLHGKEWYDSTNIAFLYRFSVVRLHSMFSIESSAFRFMYDHDSLFVSRYGKEQTDIRIVWMLDDAVYEAVETKNERLFDSAVKRLPRYDVGKLYVWKNESGGIISNLLSKHLVTSAKLRYYNSAGDMEQWKSALEQHTRQIWDDPDALNELSWNYFENAGDDTTKLSAMLPLAARAVALREDAPILDTYANILFRLGRHALAIDTEKHALELAKDHNEDITVYQNNLKGMAAAEK